MGTFSGDTMRRFLMLFALLFAPVAVAQIAPECRGVKSGADYDEVTQQDFLSNYVGLSTTLSPLHGPIPHEPGRGAAGLELAVMPPLSCERRLVLGGTKTEDTNKTPVVPRPRITFAFPAMGALRPYAGVAYVPPVPVFGTTNVLLSAEVGVGMEVGAVQLGGRFHATSHKLIGEVATPFNKGDPPRDDLFIGSSLGVDVLFGLPLEGFTPYAAMGLTDVSTFFFVGDDNVVTNNYHPYLGWVSSVGVDALVADWIRLGGEFYAAPGGYSLPDDEVESLSGMGRYGSLYTARLRVAAEL